MLRPLVLPTKCGLQAEKSCSRQPSRVVQNAFLHLKTSFKHALSWFQDRCTSASNFLLSWTPVLLVCCYWPTCTAIFVMSSEWAIRVFYYFFLAANMYIALLTLIESFLALSPVREARRQATQRDQQAREKKRAKYDLDLPRMDLIIVAYLPNEKDIVIEQVMYALEEIEYPPERLMINLVYNTPYPIEPLETRLQKLAIEYQERLRVIKVPSSTSKAHNLNYFLENVRSPAEYIGIYDTDHMPHPTSIEWAAKRFLAAQAPDAAQVDIIQGRCVVYNTAESILAKLIAVEFDKIYAISHPGRSRLWGFGLFCGSNGWWRASALRELMMRPEMLTEDIDSALRAYGAGYKAVHDLNVISFETAPNTFKTFWKQRMRWTQGWTQASIYHMPLLWKRDQPRSGRERLGVFSLLLVRELSYYFVSLHTCLMVSFLITSFPHDLESFVRLIFFRYPMAEWFFFATIISLLLTLYFTEKVRSEFTSWKSMVAFSLVYTPYLLLQSCMGIFGHFRELIGYSNWNPTART